MRGDEQGTKQPQPCHTLPPFADHRHQEQTVASGCTVCEEGASVWRHFKAIRWLTGSRPIEIRGGWAGQPHHHPALCSLVTTWLMLRYRSSSLHHNTLYLVCYDPNPNTHNLTLTLTLLTSGQIIPRNHCCSTDSVHNLSSDDKHLWNQVVSLCLATLFHFDIMLYIIIVPYNNIPSSRCTQWDRLKNCWTSTTLPIWAQNDTQHSLIYVFPLPIKWAREEL